MPISRPKVRVSIDQHGSAGPIHHSVCHSQEGDRSVLPMRDGVDEGRPPGGGGSAAAALTSANFLLLIPSEAKLPLSEAVRASSQTAEGSEGHGSVSSSCYHNTLASSARLLLALAERAGL